MGEVEEEEEEVGRGVKRWKKKVEEFKNQKEKWKFTSRASRKVPEKLT